MTDPQPRKPLWKSLFQRLFLDPVDPTTTLLWAGICGLAAGLVGLVYNLLFKSFSAVASSIAGDIPAGISLSSPEADLSWQMRLVLPAAGAALAALLLLGFRKQTLRGPADVLEAVAITDGKIPMRPSLLKVIASLFAITSGGSIGREGPVALLGAMVASKIGQFGNFSPARLRILTGCGVAAGLSMAFHTTIGSALFVMEVVFGNFAPELFGPLVLSSVMATLVARFSFGSEPLFAVKQFDFFPSELPLYIFLGVFAGAVAPLFMKTLWRIDKIFKKAVPPLWIRLPLAGLLVGAIGIWCPQVWGNGSDTIRAITDQTFGWKILLVLFLLKPLATACMVGGGAPGGVFTPTLLLGACSGGILGSVFAKIWPWPHATPVEYALVGMGAVLAGTTHAPLTAIFVLFEMTLDYDAVLPLMISASVASLISKTLHADSIYTEPLSRQGIRTSKIPEAHLLSATLVRDVMRPLDEREAVLPTAHFADIADSFMNSTHKHLYVADAAGRFVGAIRLHDFKAIYHAGDEMRFLIAEDLIQRDFATASPDDRLSQILDRFLAQDCERLPVIEGAAERKLIGTVSKSDILNLYNREILQRRSFVASSVVPMDRRADPLLVEYRIETVSVPPGWIGKTLAELDLPGRFSVMVLATEEVAGTARIQHTPKPQEPLDADAMLVVLGNPAQIRKALAS